MAKLFSKGIYNDKKVEQRQEEPEQEDDEMKITTLPDFNAENPQTFFDVEIGKEGDEGHAKGRVVFELFNADVPKTAENFRVLCTGEKEEAHMHYKGAIFHRIISGFMMQGGDTTNRNGTGGKSIYGEKFADEGVWLPHTHRGVLSMANAGPNTNGSQFFINYGPTPHLNGKHTVFGRVIHGFDICEKAENVKKGAADKPLADITIADCGELTGEDKLAKDKADYLSTYDN